MKHPDSFSTLFRTHLSRLTLGVLGFCLAASALQADQIAPGSKLPSLSSFGLEGKLPETRGKVVLVDFWASWCAPCRKSFPAFEKLHRANAAKGLVIVAVSVDDKAADMQKFLEANPVSFAVVRDSKKKLARKLQPEALPTSILVDRKGVVRHVLTGYYGKSSERELSTHIAALLAE